MAVVCDDIIRMIEKLAPPQLACDWDNAGLILGRRSRTVTKALIALDATAAVADEAIRIGAEMIITHHPVIFKAIAKINDDSPLGEKLLTLAEHKICVYAAHTNLDIARGGTNDTLAAKIGLTAIGPLFPTENTASGEEIPAIGRKGVLKQALPLAAFAELVKEKIGLDTIRFVGNANRPVKTVGLSTGAASNSQNFQEAVATGCDVFITGDIRFHEAQEALALGLALVDATHYASENLVVDQISGYLRRELQKTDKGREIMIINSAVDGQVFNNI